MVFFAVIRDRSSRCNVAQSGGRTVRRVDEWYRFFTVRLGCVVPLVVRNDAGGSSYFLVVRRDVKVYWVILRCTWWYDVGWCEVVLVVRVMLDDAILFDAHGELTQRLRSDSITSGATHAVPYDVFLVSFVLRKQYAILLLIKTRAENTC